jgi:hypothetical protein
VTERLERLEAKRYGETRSLERTWPKPIPQRFHLAERDYGKSVMEKHRKSGSRVSDTAPGSGFIALRRPSRSQQLRGPAWTSGMCSLV